MKKYLLSVCVLILFLCENTLAGAAAGHGRTVGESNMIDLHQSDGLSVQNDDLWIPDPDIIFEQNVEHIAEASIKLCDVEKKIDGLIINDREVMSISPDEKKILYRIVEAEAGGEDLSGRMLVANVVLNRVLSSEFPDTVKGVVFSHSGGTYQFSPVRDGRYYSVNVSCTTKRAVNKALKGCDNSRGALYFICRRLAAPRNASWFDRELDYLFRYGCHEFFS